MTGIQPTTKRLENADRVWHLQHTQFMEGLTSTDLQMISGMWADRIYPRGRVIFSQGDPADCFFVLNRGHVRMSMGGSNGKEKVLGILKRGDVFGEDVLESEEVRHRRATVHDECWVSVISRDGLLQLLEQWPVLNVSLIQILNRTVLEAHQELQNLSFLSVEHRISRTLLKLGFDHGRHVATTPNLMKLQINITHEQLASMVGANRPYVSSVLAKFKEKGWLRYQEKRTLINIEALQRFSGARQSRVPNSSATQTRIANSEFELTPRPSNTAGRRQKIRLLTQSETTVTKGCGETHLCRG